VLDLVLDRQNPSSFVTLVVQLKGSIDKQISSFTIDPMLNRVEDKDSLFNLALVKVSEAVSNFEYQPELTEQHNERRFLAMVKTYIRHEMIDHQYAANVDKRRPKTALLSFETIGSRPGHIYDDDELKYDPPSKEPTSLQKLEAKEFDTFMREKFCDGEEGNVYNLLSQGFPAERIAGKLGLPVSRVRYIIYEKIQKRAERFA